MLPRTPPFGTAAVTETRVVKANNNDYGYGDLAEKNESNDGQQHQYQQKKSKERKQEQRQQM